MPKHPHARANTRTRSRPTISAPATAAQPAADVQSLMVTELRELPVEVLRLHLNHHNLVTTGNRAAMAKRLHTALHAGDGPRSTAPATSVTDLERTVQSPVDKSLDGLESRLQALLRSLLLQPRASPAPLTARADNDNISLPSNVPDSAARDLPPAVPVTSSLAGSLPTALETAAPATRGPQRRGHRRRFSTPCLSSCGPARSAS